MSSTELKNNIIHALEEIKAMDIQVLDVSDKTDLTDFMIIASGTSNRHLRAMADKVSLAAKALGYEAQIEGEDSQEWVLIDNGDAIVHLMHPQAREKYALEKLWKIGRTESSL